MGQVHGDEVKFQSVFDKLKQTADIVQQAHPGTRTASRVKESALIDYIVEYSTNGHQ